MYRVVLFVVCCCVVSVWQGCAPKTTTNSEPITQQPATPSPAPPQSPDSFTIKGTLVNADGSPASAKTISIHPLDKKGKPLFVSIFEETGDGGATPKPWNPKAETDNEGRFTLSMPRIAKIGDDPLTEVALAVDAKPEGGWVAGLISRITYTNKEKKEDMCFVKDDARLKLLRNGGEVLKVKLEAGSSDLDIGTVTNQ